MLQYNSALTYLHTPLPNLAGVDGAGVAHQHCQKSHGGGVPTLCCRGTSIAPRGRRWSCSAALLCDGARELYCLPCDKDPARSASVGGGCVPVVCRLAKG